MNTTTRADSALGTAIEALDLAGYPLLAAHIAHWPSLGAYLHARDRVAWAREHAVDDDHRADCGMALCAIEAAMASAEVGS
jgi:hypothetical protein